MRVTLIGYCGTDDLRELSSFTFLIAGISRALTHQLVRHRTASFSQESQRYVDLDSGQWNMVIPDNFSEEEQVAVLSWWESTKGLYRSLRVRNRKGDARVVLPNAIETRLVVTFPYAGLIHFFNLRLHKSAQAEIRTLAGLMFSIVEKYLSESDRERFNREV